MAFHHTELKAFRLSTQAMMIKMMKRAAEVTSPFLHFGAQV
jgi:hypothetical protein